MITVFRKIRQILLSQNRIKQYSVYAIGEIVLVVIGILIALQINTWNQGRLNAERESTYLDNLTLDLQSQLISIDVQLEYENKYVLHGNIILEDYFASDSLAYDSAMSRRLSLLTERKTFVRIDPTFEDLLSTGNLGLIKDVELRRSLIEYYQELERLEKVIQNNNSLIIDQTFGHEVKDLVFVGRKSSERLIQISTELLSNPYREMKLIGHVSHRTAIAEIHIKFLNELKQQTNTTLERLRRN